MTIVTYELDKIHNSYNNRLKYDKLIPCNCAACKNSQNPCFYTFEQVQGWLSYGKRTFPCYNHPYDEFNVQSLIDDVIDIHKYEKKSEDIHPRDINKRNQNTYNHPCITIEKYINQGDTKMSGNAGKKIDITGSNIASVTGKGKIDKAIVRADL